MRSAFLFEAKGIQGFIFAGGRLRDAVGASAAVDSIAGSDDRSSAALLSALIATDEAIRPDRLRVVRRAAGSFRLLFFGADARERATRLARLTQMLLPKVVPGVDYVSAVGSGETVAEAVEDAQRVLLARRGLVPIFDPPIGPLVERAPRLGTPATGFIRIKQPSGSEGSREPADAALEIKQAKADSRRLVRRFVPDAGIDEWPFDLDQMFQGYKGARILGIVHADGNRLGAVVRTLGERLERPARGQVDALSESEEVWVRIYLKFSQAVERATRLACSDAAAVVTTKRIGGAPYPMRPLIQAGDDVTVVVRGDLALAFAERFLTAFRERTAAEIGELFADEKLGEAPVLTACAGVAFVGASQPFVDAHDLAEDLCKFAKTEAKRRVTESEAVPSALAFHRASTTINRDYRAILKRELTAEGRQLTFGPYVADKSPATGLPTLGQLRALLHALSEDGDRRGPLRTIATTLYDRPNEAERQFKRILEATRMSEPESMEGFEAALSALVGRRGSLFSLDGRTPLGDLLALKSLKAEIALA